MWEKFSIISSLSHVRDFSSNRLIESSAHVVFLFFLHGGFLGCAESDCIQERQDRDQNFYTGPRRGHAMKKKPIKRSLL
jgi:hypothetical protein